LCYSGVLIRLYQLKAHKSSIIGNEQRESQAKNRGGSHAKQCTLCYTPCGGEQWLK